MPVAVPILIGLTAYQVYNQVKTGKQAKSIGNYNAEVFEQQATDALARGTENEQRFRQSVKMLMGSQKAGFAGQGVDVSSGSALDVQADAAFLGELDALTVRTNAQREAAGYRAQAENARRGGNAAATQAYGQAAGTVLGTASLLASRYGSK